MNEELWEAAQKHWHRQQRAYAETLERLHDAHERRKESALAELGKGEAALAGAAEMAEVPPGLLAAAVAADPPVHGSRMKQRLKFISEPSRTPTPSSSE